MKAETPLEFLDRLIADLNFFRTEYARLTAPVVVQSPVPALPVTEPTVVTNLDGSAEAVNVLR